MKNRRAIFIFLLILCLQVVPVFVSADIGIPCARGTADMCGFNDVFVLINNVIKFFLKTILLPFLIILITYSGFLFMTSAGNVERRNKAKGIFKNIVIGLALILFSWFIVYTLFRAFGYDTSRGKAGLSDATVNWGGASGALSGIKLPALLTGNASNAGVGQSGSNTEYKGTAVVNSKDPANTRITITINPAAKSAMRVMVSCNNFDGNSRKDVEGKIAASSSTGSVVMNLFEDTTYNCSMENTENSLSGNFSFTTANVSGVKKFTVSGAVFNKDSIVISYKNTEVLHSDYGILSCNKTGTSIVVIPQTGVMFDRLKTESTLTYFIPANILAATTVDAPVNCTLAVMVKGSGAGSTPVAQNATFTGTLLANLNTTQNPQIDTKFAILKTTQKTAAVDLVLNTSMNVDPNLDLVCTSFSVNHLYRSKVTFDATAIQRASKNTNGSVQSTITIPVSWGGYGLRPSATYRCQLSGKTLKNVAGYKEQVVKPLATDFSVTTPLIPLPKNITSKLLYPVIIGVPRVLYKTYTPPASPLFAPPVFKQYIPDSIMVPMINAFAIDNQTLDLTCTQISGPATGSWMKKISLENIDTDNTTKAVESNFVIEISKNPATGFMHSSVYQCFARFFVEKIQMVRMFVVGTPIYIDPTAVGPVDLHVEAIRTNKEFAFFDLVASPRVQNTVNYSCSNINGSYSGEVSWVAQSLGIRMPVAIPISSTNPGLRPASVYNCEITGTTYQNQKLGYQFNIKTP